ncbi:MAG: pseudouridine synthase [Clostridia bacterium]|nr:pseudouridine synthase [Clostridia bacterium]MBQ3057780.1 pseudouridine synthase [Clostridia bacterium]
MKQERFDKIISTQFNISRRDARIAIRRGKATLNGKILRDFGALVDVDADITFNGQALNYKQYIYILMNKPKGVLSASSDKKKQTVVDLVPENLKRNGLFPVGRLDKDTTGFLIITDDGDFAHKAISPKYEVYKSYLVTLDGKLTDEMVKAFADGIVLADGTLCRKAVLTILGENTARVKICEGKYHQIKRMFGVVGLGVNELKREAVGGLSLPPKLKEGCCVELSLEEIQAIFTNS